MSKRVDWGAVRGSDSYRMILELPLEVALLRYREEAELWSDPRFKEHYGANWRISVFENCAHMLSALETWVPDVLIVHWHDQGDTHDLPMKLAGMLRERGWEGDSNSIFRAGDRPCLVGTYWSTASPGRGDLLACFDICIEVSEVNPKTIAEHLWYMLR